MSEVKPISECKTVAELLADKSRWCQGAYAKRCGEPISWLEPDAEQFCLVGAMRKVYGLTTAFSGPWGKIRLVLTCSPTGFNDSSNYEEVYAKVLEAGI